MKELFRWFYDRLAVVKSAYYDYKLGIDVGNECVPIPEQDTSQCQDMRGYQSLNYGTLERIMRSLSLNREDVFVDLGCGKGRIACYAATHLLKKVAGVELNEMFFRTAQRNADRLKGKRTPIEIVNADAAGFDLSEATVVFLFNPFGEKTLERVIKNCETSVGQKTKQLRIVYYTPRHQNVIDRQEWLMRQTQSCDGSWIIWRSKINRTQ